MAAGIASGLGTFVPSFEASGKLQVEYSRNPKKFALNKYAKLIPVKESIGYYLEIDNDEAARVLQTSLENSAWADGQEAPKGDDFKTTHYFRQFATRRYLTAFNLGQKAVEQASWDIIASYGRAAAQRRMTERTQYAVTTYSTTGNWGGNTDTCTNIAGGKLDVSTTSLNYIKELIQKVADKILKATIGAVNWEDMNMIMNPTTATLISRSAEFVDHLIQSPFALAQVRGDAPSQNGRWGLPDQLFGMNVVIEDAVKVTAAKGQTVTSSDRAYILDTGTIAFMSRPEGLMGSEGVPDFSTLQIFSYEDMTVETKNDPDNRRTAGRVVDDFEVKLVAPASGYLVTACTETA